MCRQHSESRDLGMCAISLEGYPVVASEDSVYEPCCQLELSRPVFNPAGQEELLLRVPLD